MATPKLETAPMTPAEVSVLVEAGKLVFRTDDGHWVYVSDADKPGQSVCEGPCLVKWKPIMAPATAKVLGDWTLVPRKEGKQWAFKGRPVYVFVDALTVPKGAEPGWQALNP